MVIEVGVLVSTAIFVDSQLVRRSAAIIMAKNPLNEKTLRHNGLIKGTSPDLNCFLNTAYNRNWNIGYEI
ncbi:hypothetical protein D1872_240360 [compost metagenome]